METGDILGTTVDEGITKRELIKFATNILYNINKSNCK